VRVPLGWLEEMADARVTPEELGARLTAQGLALEVIEWLGQGLAGVFVGEVLALSRHPAADELWVVELGLGARTVTVVTGADNLRVGDRVPWIEPGATLPGKGRIERRMLRGTASDGMLLSADELGMGPDADGIFVLDPTAPLGADAARLLGLPQPVLVLDLTPNVAVHCQSVAGVAREVAAAYGCALRVPQPPPLPVGPLPFAARIEQDGDCPRYVLGLATWPGGVARARTPALVRQRLLASNVRLHGLAVDVTNYVMLEMGQPLHAFDADAIEGDTIEVRRARPAEELVTLDGQHRRLTDEQLVIADRRGPIGLAGVMGGQGSEVGPATRRVLFESAWFEPRAVRRSGRSLGLFSEAQSRFEKGVDGTAVPAALSRALELCRQGGEAVEVAPGHVDVGSGRERRPRTVPLRVARVGALLGIDVRADEARDALTRLGFGVRSGGEGRLEVDVPVRRGDVEAEVDLVEEVGRLGGYDRLPDRLPQGRTTLGRQLPERAWQEALADALVGQGLAEVVMSSFVAGADLDRLAFGREGRVTLDNPLGPDIDTMRPSLLPGLLRAFRVNVERGRQGVWLFERGTLTRRAGSDLGGWPPAAGAPPGPDWPFEERQAIAALAYGPPGPESWRGAAPAADFFAVKGVVGRLLDAAYGPEGEGWSVRAIDPGRDGDWGARLHPGRAAVVEADGAPVGVVGEIHPVLLATLDLPGPVIYSEWWHDLGPRTRARVGSTPSRYPAATRDVAVVLPQEVDAQRVLAAARVAGAPWLEEARLFDVYTGAPIPAGARSLALRIRYRAADRTLREDEVEAAHGRVRDALRDLGGTLRS